MMPNGSGIKELPNDFHFGTSSFRWRVHLSHVPWVVGPGGRPYRRGGRKMGQLGILNGNSTHFHFVFFTLPHSFEMVKMWIDESAFPS